MKKLFLFGVLAAVTLTGYSQTSGGATGATTEDTKPGIEIAGSRWAEFNVDKPGTFAAKPTDPGKLYQWNRITAWSTTEPRKAYGADGNEIPGAKWDKTNAEGNEWAKENDPCPEGWRMPDLNEIVRLCSWVKSEWVAATAKTAAGRKFTDDKSGKSIFLPAVGNRNDSTGVFVASSFSNYWSAAKVDTVNAYLFTFGSGVFTPSYKGGYCNYGYSVRCVAK